MGCLLMICMTAVVAAAFSEAVHLGKPKAVMISCMSQVHSPTFKERLHFRSRAEDKTTIWLFDGEELMIHFDLSGPAVVDIIDVRYANDGDYDVISVGMDGQELGQFKTTTYYAWGHLWNEFDSSGPLGGPHVLGAGHHNISLKVLHADEYGMEVDYIRVSVHGSHMENMENEHFMCVHNPGKGNRHTTRKVNENTDGID
ncbi:hypothetical protein DPMN_026158 [Dreissena polymorpha]|uniref:Uncharacterized protein n=1 Tax=Dreissena polymorpha TaxID=45954 RepID=A0A9D4LSW6_DREPO|nr:hypothetical protein DPMN_026158 [Dreissena polymorpha]